MSISATLSSALSGLTAAARGAETVASNVANARTPGYARRELSLGARMVGGVGNGVQVTGTVRVVDKVLLGDRRVAQAGAGAADLALSFLARVEGSLGTPGDPTALSGRIGALEGALLAAAGRPESEARLADVLASATALAATLSRTSGEVQDARLTADRAIAQDVAVLNTTLAQIADINGQIRAFGTTGRETASLADQRQALVDRIAGIVPLREMDRDFGQIALYTTGGIALVDGLAAQFGFDPVGAMVPQMTLAGGALSGLTINGAPLPLGEGSGIAGGTLATQFELRDQIAPQIQGRLDALARDLIVRFEDPALDPTRAPGTAGLFTDAGAPFDAAAEGGLAQRLAVNPLVDPGRGGALWRLRDGLGAPVPGPTGASSLLNRTAEALTRAGVPASGGFLPAARSFAALAADTASDVASRRIAAEDRAAFTTSKVATLRQFEGEDGVDTDREMQILLQIEQAYAANARVIQGVDKMIETLLGI